MEHIFYLLLILPFLLEVESIINPSGRLKLRNLSKKLKKEEVKFDDWPSELKATSYLALIYFTLVFVGLFTFQWYIFLIILALSFIPKANKLLIVIDGVITLSLLVFALINKYHGIL